MGGKTDVAGAVQVANLALKHRRNKHGGKRIVVFVGSPIEDDVKTLIKVGKSLKKESVAVDVISMGEIEDNKTKLQVGLWSIIPLDSQYPWGHASLQLLRLGGRGLVKMTSERCCC